MIGRARIGRNRALVWALLFLVSLFAPRLAQAEGGALRLAIVVGNNGSGTLERAELRYADDDAAKYAALLGSADGSEVELLTRFDGDSARMVHPPAIPPTRAALDAAVARVAARAAEAKTAGREVVFTFVFAGHGDVEGGRGFVELEDGRYFREDLEAMISKIPAKTVHVLLDACNSVYMLAARKPGGTRFATPEDVERSMRARMANVGTFLSTSADAEVYEWSQIESGVFSHLVRSGLAGAADLDGDGRITYGELRAFARVAVRGIPNPRFRPRIYARGPGGRDDEVIFEPRAARRGARYALDAGPERRVTVLDADETPLVDVRLEQGFGTKIVLPAAGADARFTLTEHHGKAPDRRTALVMSDDGSALIARADAPPAPIARASRPFDLLFAAPFGPRAVAALPPEEPEREVYGVSIEERERMRRLLDAAGGYKHDTRFVTGLLSGSLGLAFGTAGALALALPPSRASERQAQHVAGGVLLGVGGLGLGIGAHSFLVPSKMEDRRDQFAATIHAHPEAFDLAVRNAEQQLMKEAESARMMRKAVGGAAVVFGGVVSVLGVALEIAPGVTSDGRYVAHGAIVLGGVETMLGIGILLVRSEPERLFDLWANDPSISRTHSPPPSSLRVQPTLGLGSVGLGGTF